MTSIVIVHQPIPQELHDLLIQVGYEPVSTTAGITRFARPMRCERRPRTELCQRRQTASKVINASTQGVEHDRPR